MAFTDIETSYDPHSKYGLMLADTVAAETSDPLDMLIQLEEMLMEQYGLTLMQAIAQGVIQKRH